MDYNDYAKVWQSKKSSGTHYAHKFLEKPAMYKIAGFWHGRRVLDVGCGSGEDSKKLIEQGNEVVGIDYAESLLELARFDVPEASFYCIDLNKLGQLEAEPETEPELEDLGEEKFDCIYSSLTMHYIKDWSLTLDFFHEQLKEGGEVLFSCHHPIKWSSEVTKNKEQNSFILGYTKSKNNPHPSHQTYQNINSKNKAKDYRIYGDYLNTRAIEEKLFGQLDIIHYGRSLSTMLKDIREGGFELIDFIEPKPIEEAKVEIPDFYEVHSKIPLFCIFHLKKI